MIEREQELQRLIAYENELGDDFFNSWEESLETEKQITKLENDANCQMEKVADCKRKITYLKDSIEPTSKWLVGILCLVLLGFGILLRIGTDELKITADILIVGGVFWPIIYVITKMYNKGNAEERIKVYNDKIIRENEELSSINAKIATIKDRQKKAEETFEHIYEESSQLLKFKYTIMIHEIIDMIKHSEAYSIPEAISVIESREHKDRMAAIEGEKLAELERAADASERAADASKRVADASRRDADASEISAITDVINTIHHW